jgi:hypothetical protein
MLFVVGGNFGAADGVQRSLGRTATAPTFEGFDFSDSHTGAGISPEMY